METIKYVTNPSELPESLPVDGLLMNGTGDELELGGGSVGDITSFEGTVTGSSLSELADFANRCACVGALLSHDNGTFTIWNGDNTAAGYWDPQATETSSPSTQYGTVIAVCAGKGLWVAKDAVDAENGYLFAPDGTDLYNYFLKTCVTGSGWDNTQHILTNYYVGHESTYEGTIWGWMKGVESENLVLANHLFIPNAEELRKVCFNTMDDVYTGQQDESETSQSFQYSRNIGVLLGLAKGSFWSSSQYCDGYLSAFYVSFYNGNVYGNGKFSGYYSLALLHFDALA